MCKLKYSNTWPLLNMVFVPKYYLISELFLNSHTLSSYSPKFDINLKLILTPSEMFFYKLVKWALILLFQWQNPITPGCCCRSSWQWRLHVLYLESHIGKVNSGNRSRFPQFNHPAASIKNLGPYNRRCLAALRFFSRKPWNTTAAIPK